MEFTNKHGQVTLQREQNIITASFYGNINASLVAAFGNGLFEQIKQLTDQPWAYISSSHALMAATPDAEQKFTQLTATMIRKGCIASAYIFGSSLVINQMQRIILNAGIDLDIQQCLFNNIEDAKAYVNKKIAHQKDSRASRAS